MAVVHRQRIDWYSKAKRFGNSTVDDIIASGLMRLTKLDHFDYLECSYVLYLLLDFGAHPWSALCEYAPRAQREDFKPCRLWGELNCKVRVLRSMALFEENSVDLKMLHPGARFGTRAGWSVREVPHKYGPCPAEMKAKPVSSGECSCAHEASGSMVYYPPANGLPSFLCQTGHFQDTFHEIHHCKVVPGGLSEEECRQEQKNWTGDDDFFVLYCTGDVRFDVCNLTKCAVVDRSGWAEFYGPFAARALFAATAPPRSGQSFTLVEQDNDPQQAINKRKTIPCEPLGEDQEGVVKALPTAKRHRSPLTL